MNRHKRELLAGTVRSDSQFPMRYGQGQLRHAEFDQRDPTCLQIISGDPSNRKRSVFCLQKLITDDSVIMILLRLTLAVILYREEFVIEGHLRGARAARVISGLVECIVAEEKRVAREI